MNALTLNILRYFPISRKRGKEIENVQEKREKVFEKAVTMWRECAGKKKRGEKRNKARMCRFFVSF